MSHNVIPLAGAFRPGMFEAELRRRAAREFSHMVQFTTHAVERMKERGITRTMVLRILSA